MSEATVVQTPVQRALARQMKASAALPEGEGERIAFEIIEAAAQAGKTNEQYIIDYAKGLDVAAPREGMKSAFWSFGIPHPDLPSDKVLSSQFLASVWTDMENEGNEGSARYLEGTPGGEDLGRLHLWNPEVYKVLGLNESQGDDLARDAWSALSENYAKATDGEAIVFAGEIVPWSVAYETEMPQLRRVAGPENIHFMYDLPEDVLKGLPPESRELLSEGWVRSHVHFRAPDTDNPPSQKYWAAGHVDLEQLRSLPTPELQRAAVLEACARVAYLDGTGRETDVERLVEEIKTLRPDHEVVLPTAGERAVTDQQQAQGHTPPSTPAVRTHAPYMPGVTVNARTGPAPLESLTLPTPQTAAASAHDFLPGVTRQAKPIAAPAVGDAPATPSQAPPAPEQSRDTGMGV
ncbi:hypothetical protein OHS71_19865 [Streptomyces sp. NBC_00377]|uniref:hypothetical protein n=1 Tax=unclassified Streptomyces TaxID=2593676 RepID=UPI002E21E41A|nr:MULTISPECIES: hypothetical protein [unclassified Streptomyces]